MEGIALILFIVFSFFLYQLRNIVLFKHTRSDYQLFVYINKKDPTNIGTVTLKIYESYNE